MNIGILGSGAVAQSLGAGFIKHGHKVMEPLCILWCIPGFLHNEWTHAFKVLHA